VAFTAAASTAVGAADTGAKPESTDGLRSGPMGPKLILMGAWRA
jgi:hypothetical protein